MAISTYEEFGIKHRVLQLGNGKILRFTRANTGERWQNPGRHQDYISCVIWENDELYIKDQQQWQKTHVGFEFYTKSRQRFFWTGTELAALKEHNKQLLQDKRRLIIRIKDDAKRHRGWFNLAINVRNSGEKRLELINSLWTTLLDSYPAEYRWFFENQVGVSLEDVPDWFDVTFEDTLE